MALEQYANSPTLSSPTTAWTTLSGSILAGDVSLTVASASAFPSSAQFRILIDDELLLATAGAGTTTWTVTRGVESTTAAAHSSGASVYHVLTAASLLRAPGGLTTTGDVPYLASTGAPTRLAAGADGTFVRYASGVPTANTIQLGDLPAGTGLTASPLSQFASTSSTQLRGVLSDETGTGVAVFNDTPTLLTPTIASLVNATHTHLNAAGGGTLTAAAVTDLATASVAFSNKTGNISQWTNDSAYLTSVAIGSVTGLGTGVATFLATPSSANLASAITDETGSGALVFGTSPTLVTPTIASFANATHTHLNAAGGGTITLAAISDFGTGVATFLATPSSANLAAAVTNETGSGLLVFATSPTLTTPVLGVATATSLNGNTFTTGTYTLTGVAGKTLTFNKSLTLEGTDSTTLTFPTTSATIARTDAAQTFTGSQTIAALVGPVTITEAVGSSGLTLTGATQTSSFPVLSATQTWNASGTTFTGSLLNITNTASAAASMFVDYQIAGTSVFKIIKSNHIVTAATLEINPASGDFYRYGFSSSAFTILNTNTIGWNATSAGAPDLILSRPAAATLQLGNDTNGAAVSQILWAASGVTGTDKTGGNFTLASGKGTGAGAVSSLIFQTPTVLGSGTTAQSLATRLTIDSSGLTIADAMNVVLNATTGTKFGTATTQKLAFYGSTPITCAVLATGAAATVDNVITALQNLGLVKQS